MQSFRQSILLGMAGSGGRIGRFNFAFSCRDMLIGRYMMKDIFLHRLKNKDAFLRNAGVMGGYNFLPSDIPYTGIKEMQSFWQSILLGMAGSGGRICNLQTGIP